MMIQIVKQIDQIFQTLIFLPVLFLLLYHFRVFKKRSASYPQHPYALCRTDPDLFSTLFPCAVHFHSGQLQPVYG